MEITLYIITTITMCFFLLIFRYRLTKSKTLIGESEVKYKVVDIGQNDTFRYHFESLLQKKRIYLKDKFNTTEWLYVDKKDFMKLHSESPLKMKEKHYTITFKFETKQLIFDGFSISKVISYNKINKEPEVLK